MGVTLHADLGIGALTAGLRPTALGAARDPRAALARSSYGVSPPPEPARPPPPPPAVAAAAAARLDARSRADRRGAAGAGIAQGFSRSAGDALGRIDAALSRMREIAGALVGAAGPEDVRLREEFDALATEVDAIAGGAAHRGIVLLDGSFGEREFQTGAAEGETVTLAMPAARLADLGLSGLDVSDPDGAEDASDRIDDALAEVAARRAAVQAQGGAASSAAGGSTAAAAASDEARARLTDTTPTDAERARQAVADQARAAHDRLARTPAGVDPALASGLDVLDRSLIDPHRLALSAPEAVRRYREVAAATSPAAAEADGTGSDATAPGG